MTRETEDAVDRRFEASLRELAERERAGLEPHPDPIELFDYHLGEIAEPRQSEIAAHRDRCPECARVLADFAAFPEISDPDLQSQSPEEEAESLRQIEARLLHLSARPRKRNERPRFRRLLSWGALAAVLLLSFGLGRWNGQRARANEVLLAEEFHVLRTNLRGDAQEITIHPGEREAFFQLTFFPPISLETFRLEVHDVQGRLVFGHDGQGLRDAEALTLVIPTSILPRGIVTFRLTHRVDGREVVVAETSALFRFEPFRSRETSQP